MSNLEMVALLRSFIPVTSASLLCLELVSSGSTSLFLR